MTEERIQQVKSYLTNVHDYLAKDPDSDREGVALVFDAVQLIEEGEKDYRDMRRFQRSYIEADQALCVAREDIEELQVKLQRAVGVRKAVIDAIRMCHKTEKEIFPDAAG